MFIKTNTETVRRIPTAIRAIPRLAMPMHLPLSIRILHKLQTLKSNYLLLVLLTSLQLLTHSFLWPLPTAWTSTSRSRTTHSLLLLLSLHILSLLYQSSLLLPLLKPGYPIPNTPSPALTISRIYRPKSFLLRSPPPSLLCTTICDQAPKSWYPLQLG